MPKTLTCLLVLAALASDSFGEAVDYTSQIKPILMARCAACHGSLKAEAGLRLDASTAIRHGSENGPVLMPGDSAGSLIIERVTAGEDERMPPEGAPLDSKQIALLKSWIDAGARAPEETLPPPPDQHWSFVGPVRPRLPQAPQEISSNIAYSSPSGRGGVKAIDAFLAREQKNRGITPLGEAEKHVLLRRATLDLIGLPPTRAELHTFLSDTSPDAYERMIDRLLASPHYGERWGRHWMDVWRYSDWAGFQGEVRDSQKHMWRFRDWIVESLNRDKPYDQMIVEMLAADEIAPSDPDALRATGFLARNYFRFNRNIWLERTVEHTSKALLGLTFNCAKCHDHKFDPISQQDYYHFRAFFEPYEVRLERVPGQPDVEQNGIPRVYDEKLDAPTYLMVRGDENRTVKDKSYEPALPQIFKWKLQVAAVSLPATSSYPGLLPTVQRDLLAKYEKGAKEARATIAALEKQLSAAEVRLAAISRDAPTETKVASVPAVVTPPAKAVVAAVDVGVPAVVGAGPSPAPSPQETPIARPKPWKPQVQAEQAVEDVRVRLDVSRAKVAVADLEYRTVQAKVLADRASMEQASNAAELARTASSLERECAVVRAELECVRAQADILSGQRKLADDPRTTGPLARAKTRLASADKLREKAKSELNKQTVEYRPLTEKYPATSTGRRTALARWIASERNPLTARVAVNHIWMRHFGAPLVPTVFDFGHAGRPPVHAELLDWLACELMDSGWSMKRIHRLIMTSDAYKRQSHVTATAEANQKIDPENHYLWRMNSRRLEGEAVRDSVLAASGELDVALGGPDADYAEGLTGHRRSLYYRTANEKQMLFLRLFDGANVNECYRRSESIVPQQALAMANSPLTLLQAPLLARKLSAELDAGNAAADGKFIAAAFETILGRTPSTAERDRAEEFLKRRAEQANAADKNAAKKSPAVTKSDPDQRGRTLLVHVLMNHHEFVTLP